MISFADGDRRVLLRKLRYLPPNLITLLSLTLGLLAIHFALHGDPEEAAWFILYSVLLDKLDGALARFLNAQSDMGVQLDSFADFIAFGIAPGCLLYGVLSNINAGDSFQANFDWIYLTALVYVFGCVLRLARFNIVEEESLPGFFQGLPSTQAGGIIAGFFLVIDAHGVNLQTTSNGLGIMLVVVGLLMVSPIYIPKFGNTRTAFWKWFQISNVAIFYTLVGFREFPEYLLFIGVAYLFTGAYIGAQRSRELRKAGTNELRVGGN